MQKVWYCFAVMLLFSGPQLNAQNIELMHCMVDLEKQQEAIMNKLGIKEAKLIDGRYIDPNRTGFIDSAFFVQSLRKIFPSPNATGWGLLDLEDKNYSAIRAGSWEGVSFEQGMNEFIKMIRIAKRERPFVKWSIYNIPFTTYYDKDDLWKNQEKRLKPLLEWVDIITPSLYDFYPDTTRGVDDAKYFADNLELSLRVGYNLNKPVMPYIWHRWHDGNRYAGLDLINPAEFKRNLKQILSASYNGTKVSGLIWFGAQNYFHRVTPGLAERDVKRMGGRKSDVKDRALNAYGSIIVEAAGKSTSLNVKPKKGKK